MKRILPLAIGLALCASAACADQDPNGNARSVACGSNITVWAFVTTTSMLPAANATMTGQTMIPVSAPIGAETCENLPTTQTLYARYHTIVGVDGNSIGSRYFVVSGIDPCASTDPGLTASATIYVGTPGTHQASVSIVVTGTGSQDCTYPNSATVKMEHTHQVNT